MSNETQRKLADKEEQEQIKYLEDLGEALMIALAEAQASADVVFGILRECPTPMLHGAKRTMPPEVLDNYEKYIAAYAHVEDDNINLRKANPTASTSLGTSLSCGPMRALEMENTLLIISAHLEITTASIH